MNSHIAFGQPTRGNRCFGWPATLTALLICSLSYGQNPLTTPNTAKKSAADYDIAMWQSKIAEDPGFYGNYARLCLSYVRKARETGEISYYNLADQTLQAEEQNTLPDKSLLLSLRATIHFAKHDFSEAATESEEAIKIDPEYVAAYATIGDANLEQGEYKNALAAYMKLSGYGAGDYKHGMLRYDFVSRMAHYDFIMGDSNGSIAGLRSANDVLGGLNLGKETPAWTQFILADELFMAGDLGAAQDAANASLKRLPTYHRALAELGKIRAAQGRYAEAIDYYKQAIAVIPLPIYVASLGDLYARTGSGAEAEKQYRLVEFIGKLSALNQVVYNRELALFYADHNRNLPEALRMAKAEMTIRHDVYTWDTLAWVLYKNGRGPEAISAIQKAMEFNTPDSAIFFHAGMIYSKFGDRQEGHAYLKKALAFNPQFHPLFADQARRELGTDAVRVPSVSAKSNGETKTGAGS